jgi:hypothetical protein
VAVGKAIIRPLLQTMATAFEEQAQSVQKVIDQATALVVQDERLTRKLILAFCPTEVVKY